MDWIAQAEPSHRSARVKTSPESLHAGPTAVHADAASQETPDSPAALALEGFAVVWIVQVVPFHCSASGALPSVVGGPTAVHAVAVGHETPPRIGVPVAGLGVDWIAQLDPLNRSASVVLGIELLVAYPPTAVHAVFELHDTPSRTAAVVPAGLGVDVTPHLLPFQRSARVLVG